MRVALYPSVQRWNLNIKPPKFVRAILGTRRYANAIISLMLWTAVIVYGSLIAYV
ncbi:MAG: hypothetical protein VKK42_26030 [Lyngbya sp.]|nr:hypothetical protein [Lyngbya sp.]